MYLFSHMASSLAAALEDHWDAVVDAGSVKWVCKHCKLALKGAAPSRRLEHLVGPLPGLGRNVKGCASLPADAAAKLHHCLPKRRKLGSSKVVKQMSIEEGLLSGNHNIADDLLAMAVLRHGTVPWRFMDSPLFQKFCSYLGTQKIPAYKPPSARAL